MYQGGALDRYNNRLKCVERHLFVGRFLEQFNQVPGIGVVHYKVVPFIEHAIAVFI